MMNDNTSEVYQGVADPVASYEQPVRAQFIRHTYAHLAGAILAFVCMEAALLQVPACRELATTMTSSQAGWLIVLGLFMGVSWIANRWAVSNTSVGMQYLGLGLYVIAEAIVFLPLILVANTYYDGIITEAAVLTLGLTAALTAIVFLTRANFSFLGPILTIGGLVALGAIVASVIFGFSLGIIFSAVMALFAGGAILYTTSNVMREYRPDQHVAAALALFASVALLFWYILRILMALRRD